MSKIETMIRYDIFDYSTMRESYRSKVVEPMACLADGMVENKWEKVFWDNEKSIWVRAKRPK